MVPKPTYEKLKKENLQLKKAVAKLKTDSEKYQAIFNHNLNCIYMHDLSGNFLDANNAALSLMGYSRKEIPELNLSSLIDADQLPAAASAIEEIVKIGFQKRLTEYKVKKKDGSCGWVETESTLICQQGKPFAIHGVARNISQRKRAEKALKTSEKKYRELVQSINSVVLRLDPQGNIMFINEFAEKFFGYTEKEIIGKNVIGTIVPKTESSGRDLTAMIEDLGLHPERYINHENENMRKNGRRVWIAWTNKGVQNADGNILEILCVGNDITERKKAQDSLQAREQELEDKTDELEEMNAALRVLLKKREDDRIELEKKIQFNAKQLIEPYLDDLKKTRLSPRQASLQDIIKTNLDEIISPFACNFASTKYKLTPQEIKIASLIRLGKTTKNIAELMGLSTRTIEFHRTKIRLKLGLKNKTDSLQSYLLPLK
jgi:PAS domain S-box-containing protein